MQVHQLHYLFFGFTCAHWSYALFYMLPSATFYAADVVLRLHSTYTCAAATARVHGKDGGMMTLLLPVPDSAAQQALITPPRPLSMRWAVAKIDVAISRDRGLFTEET